MTGCRDLGKGASNYAVFDPSTKFRVAGPAIRYRRLFKLSQQMLADNVKVVIAVEERRGATIVIETFARGCSPRNRPTAPVGAIRIDTS